MEFIYGKDLNAVVLRNADLREPVRNLPGPDGRPFFGELDDNGQVIFGSWELNPDGNSGIYVIDNTDEGHNFNFTAQLRKTFDFGLNS
ncbi:MAG: hypothetical protein GWN00_16300, partial [Aliifodinibius sp.]|nr:hypothetical protein [Fodinibius sp.]NIV12603.1 hypothetical protein [Fodinibius sp.]NIY26309.1 hypothetical protein [Fodinibius sp.]